MGEEGPRWRYECPQRSQPEAWPPWPGCSSVLDTCTRASGVKGSEKDPCCAQAGSRLGKWMMALGNLPLVASYRFTESSPGVSWRSIWALPGTGGMRACCTYVGMYSVRIRAYVQLWRNIHLSGGWPVTILR